MAWMPPARGRLDGAAIRGWSAAIGGEDEAEIRRIGAEIGLSPRWPSQCPSGKQKAAGHVQPPISCVAVATPKQKITSSSSLSFSLLSSPCWSSCVESSKTRQKLIRTKTYHAPNAKYSQRLRHSQEIGGGYLSVRPVNRLLPGRVGIGRYRFQPWRWPASTHPPERLRCNQQSFGRKEQDVPAAAWH
jgi:hypothetical protein